jgi:hypothetical protein
MSWLYKRNNALWRLLVRTRLTHAVWAPLVRLTLARHLRLRRRVCPLTPALSPAVAGERET